MKQVILAAVNLQKEEIDVNQSLMELEELANACNLEVVGTITQKLPHFNKTMYFNRGKVDELKLMIEATGATNVVFDDELSGVQQRNLSEVLELEVMDRTMLILEIFASRAKTKEAKLQVDIAQMKYNLPRLIGQNAELYSQQGGSGFRGSGETKLEIQKRGIYATMSKLENELAELTSARKTQRIKRDKNELYKVALVGYTNAGKSTILNGMVSELEDKKVFEKDMLFATLETSTRRIEGKNVPAFLITDTVGFVSKLPHTLVKAFRSTLEEVLEADLLLHVIDASNPEHEMQRKITNKVLEELGANALPMIYLYNKVDLVDEFESEEVCISARKEAGITTIKDIIYEQMFLAYELVTVLLPYHEYTHFDYLKRNGVLIQQEDGDQGVYLTIRLRPQDVEKYQLYIVDQEN